MLYTPVRPPKGAAPVRINLYSDTQTRPTEAMREAMRRAEVGDEQHGDDPTVHALCDRMAALLGKEAAIFLPSGTMCNVIAILTHCRVLRTRSHPAQRRRRARRAERRAQPNRSVATNDP